MKNIDNLIEEFKDIEKIYFKENYRSTQTILRTAASLMKSIRKENRDLSSNIGEGDRITLKYCVTEKDEIEFITNEILNIKKERKTFKSIAILCREKHMMKNFEENFSEQSIPYRIVKTSSYFSSQEIQALFNYMRYIKTGNVQYFKITINIPFRVSQYVLEVCGNEENIETFKENLLKQNLDKEDLEGVKKYFFIIDKLLQMNEKKEKISKIIDYLIEILLDFIKVYDFQNFNEKYDNLQEIKSTALNLEKETNEKSLDPISIFLDHVDSIIETNEKNSDQSVVITTLHGSKGLEWETVFIPGVEEGIIPHRLTFEPAEIEEERRLLFVGITRAKNNLFLTNCVVRKYGYHSHPSRFLSILEKECPKDLNVIKLNERALKLLESTDQLDPSQKTDTDDSFIEDDYKDKSPSKIFKNLLLYPPDVCFIETYFRHKKSWKNLMNLNMKDFVLQNI